MVNYLSGRTLTFFSRSKGTKGTKRHTLEGGAELALDPEPFAQGAFGAIYKAKKIIKKTNKPVDNKELVVKEIKKQFYDEKEVTFLSQYYGVDQVIDRGDSFWIVTDYQPGVELTNNEGQLAPEVEKLSLAGKANLIFELALSYNLLHHNRLFRKAIVHGDVKGENIKVDIDPKTGRCNVYILDFGLSYASDDSNLLIKTNGAGGTISFMAPEVYKERKISAKSDLYSFLPLLLMILGVENPFALKEQALRKEIVNTKFDFTGLFNTVDIPNYPDIKSAVRAFLERLQHDDYDQRPNSDEFLRFATAFKTFCKVYQTNSNDIDTLQIQTAIIASLGSGEWKENQIANAEKDTSLAIAPTMSDGFAPVMGDSTPAAPIAVKDESKSTLKNETLEVNKKKNDKIEVNLFNTIRPNNIPEVLKKYGYVPEDFKKAPLFTKAVEKLDQHGLLSEQHVILLIEDGYRISAIHKISEAKLLDRTILIRILESNDVCQKIIDAPSAILSYLVFTNDVDRQKFMAKLTKADKLQYFNYLLANREKLEKAFKGDFSKIYKLLSQSLINDYVQYAKKLEGQKKSSFNAFYSLWRTNSFDNEISASKLLINCFKNGDFAQYFSPSNSGNKKVYDTQKEFAPIFKMLEKHKANYDETISKAALNPFGGS